MYIMPLGMEEGGGRMEEGGWRREEGGGRGGGGGGGPSDVEQAQVAVINVFLYTSILNNRSDVHHFL